MLVSVPLAQCVSMCARVCVCVCVKQVYYIAAVGVVYDPETHVQHFFQVQTCI